jgi:hypothetical protein
LNAFELLLLLQLLSFMNGYYRTEPRRRFPSQNRHPIDVFSGYDDTEFHQPSHQQPNPQQNTFAPIREQQPSTQGSGQGQINGGGFYSEYRSGRSSVPAHLLNSSQNHQSEPIFNRSFPTSTTQQSKIPFIDTASDFEYPLTPKQILDTFQRQTDAYFGTSSKPTNNNNIPWTAQKVVATDRRQTSSPLFDNNWSKPQQQDISSFQTSIATKVPWRQQQQNNFQSISSDNNANSTSTNRLIDDLLAPYSLETSSLSSPQAQQHQQQRPNNNPNNSVNFRNPQPYYPYRRPSSALADPFVHTNSNSVPSNNYYQNGTNTIGSGQKISIAIDPLRQQNRERIQPLNIRNPFAGSSNNNGNDFADPRPTHRTFSEPNSQPPHTLDILSTSLYDPSSPYYSSSARQPQPQQQVHQEPQQREYNNNNNFQKSHFSDSDDIYFDDDGDMSKTTANWKNSFAAMRDRFGSKEKTPDESNDHLPFGYDHSFASNGSLTMPRSRGLLKSASQSSAVGKVEPSRSSSLLREAVVNRRASEAPDFLQQNGNSSSTTFYGRQSETPEPTAKRPLGNFWIETVKNRPTSPSIPRLPFKMTTAAERLEQLHEPIDSNGGMEHQRNQDFYGGQKQSNGGYGGGNSIFRKAAPESVIQRRNQFVENYSSSPKNSNGFHDNSAPFPSERYVSERKLNGHPNFSSLDNAVADLKQNAEKLFNDSRGCARFPIGEFNPPQSATKRLGIFTGTRISPPRYIPTQQHSPSPDSLSGESNTSIAQLPHPRPKHNIREQLMNAGANTHFGPYIGRRSVTPNFPAPNSGSVASRISVFEKRPGTPTLLQLASASTSSMPDTPEPPRSPLSPRTTVYRTKPVIHMEMNENNGSTRGGAISPEYDNKHIATVSTSAAFHFPHKAQIVLLMIC